MASDLDKIKIQIYNTNKKRNKAQYRLKAINKKIEKIKNEADKAIVEEQSKKPVFEQTIFGCDRRIEWLNKEFEKLNSKN